MFVLPTTPAVAHRKDNSRRRVVVGEILPKPSGAPPRTEAPAVLGTSVEMHPAQVDGQKRPQRGERAAQRMSHDTTQTHRHAPEEQERDGREQEHGRPERDRDHLQAPLARDLGRDEAGWG